MYLLWKDKGMPKGRLYNWEDMAKMGRQSPGTRSGRKLTCCLCMYVEAISNRSSKDSSCAHKELVTNWTCGSGKKWYPALTPSLVGRFSCLTKELVTRLNFGSASAQAAQPLLRLVIRCSPSCSGSSPSLHPTSVPFWGPRCYWLPMPCPHLPSLMNFVNSTRRSLVARFRTPRGPKTGPPTRIGLPMAH
jgi:hypothetical protein